MIKFILLFLTLLSLLDASVKPITKDVTLALAWKHQFQFAGYYMAKELGYYEDAGLNVTIKEFSLNRNISQEVSQLKYDFGVGHSTLLVDRLTKYPDIVLLNAIHQSSPLVLLSKKRQDLKTLSDVVGKTILMSQDHSFDASINAMLLSKGIKFQKYTASHIGSILGKLISGDADLVVAYTSNETFALKKKGIESTIFDPKEYGYDFYSDILFTSGAMLKNDKDTVDEFTKVSLQGWIYAYSHIEETVALILEKYNTQKRTKEALTYEANTLKKLAFKEGVAFGNINKIKLQAIDTTLRLLGLIRNDKKIDYDTFIYSNDIGYKISEEQMKKNLLDDFLNQYREHLGVILLFIVLGIGTNLYYRNKTKLLLKKQAQELDKNLEIFDKHVSASRTDIDGKIVYVTQAFCRATGYTQEELIGKSHKMLRFKDESNAIKYRDLWMTISSGHTWTGELKNIDKGGNVYWIRAVISPIFDTKGAIIGYEGIREDISANKILKGFNQKLEEEVQKKTLKLTKLATTDKLTGIFNRVKTDEVLEKNFQYFVKNRENFSVILIDIDLFKDVNDTYGHQVGDEVLKEVTRSIEKEIRSSDVFGRWGGEEFMVICPHTSVVQAKNLAIKINKAVSTFHFSRIKSLTVSAGVADIKCTKNIDALILSADNALYKAKRDGRNRVESSLC